VVVSKRYEGAVTSVLGVGVVIDHMRMSSTLQLSLFVTRSVSRKRRGGGGRERDGDDREPWIDGQPEERKREEGSETDRNTARAACGW
jgi:hypothetical protein